MTTPAKSFVRDATGLVREISFLDHLVTNMNGVVPLAAIALTPWWIWFAVPGGDPLVATVMGFIFSLVGSIVSYAMLSATFPRSAAPYVATSRVLHPAIGWPAEALMWVGWILALALYPSFMITWGLVPGLYTMGISTGNPGLVATAAALTHPINVIAVGAIFLIICLAVTVLGTKRLVRSFQLPMTIIMFIGIIVIVAVWVGSSSQALDSVLPSYLGSNSTAIVNYAHTNYSSAFAPFSWAPVPILFSLGFTAGSFNTYWNAYASGEVRRANEAKTHLMAMLIPSLLIAVMVFIVLGSARLTVGNDILVSINQILSNNASFFSIPAITGFSGSITLILVPMMVANNPIVQFIIMASVVAATFCYVPATMLILSRECFAWSFDRLIPAKFADVSDRFHVPVFSIAFNWVLGFIVFVIFTFDAAYLGFFTTAAWDTTLVTVSVLCLAAALLPLRKSLWSVSPVNKYKIAGIPVVSIGGILGFFYNGLAVYAFTFTPLLGFGLPSTLVLVVTFIVPFVLYWIIKAIRTSQGIDVGIIFRTIPPE
ncbi:MAG TPA: amino acid permease [Candidatus Acidoferrales bacterium]|nr:amino acid permease [Candidatus Acidoferrales bacterium]